MKRWPVRPLGDFVARKSGSVDPSKFTEEIFDLYSIPAFDAGEPQICAGSEIGSAKQVVQPKDVLLSRIVPHIRRAWVVGPAQGRRLIASGEWIVFRSPEFHPPFLRYFLIGDPFHSQFMQTVSGVGGSLLRAKASEVAKITIPVPPLAEQERIVKLLDEADALRKLRAQADRRTAALLAALFNEMFGDPEINPHSWPTTEIGHLLLIAPSYGTMIPAKTDSGGWLTLRVANIQDGLLTLRDKKYVDLPPELTDRHSVKDGDLLLARAIGSLDHLGKCVVVNPGAKKWAFDSHLMRVRLNPLRCEPVWMKTLLDTPGGRRLFLSKTRKSAVQFNINSKEFASITVPVPPLPLQQTFARRVGEIRELEAAQAASRRRLDALFASLLHRAFAGEL